MEFLGFLGFIIIVRDAAVPFVVVVCIVENMYFILVSTNTKYLIGHCSLQNDFDFFFSHSRLPVPGERG